MCTGLWCLIFANLNQIWFFWLKYLFHVFLCNSEKYTSHIIFHIYHMYFFLCIFAKYVSRIYLSIYFIFIKDRFVLCFLYLSKINICLVFFYVSMTNMCPMFFFFFINIYQRKIFVMYYFICSVKFLSCIFFYINL